jgi:predicted 3-demethylubiquinone-9 3-methyltransferase (glyoxalase superfamily)
MQKITPCLWFDGQLQDAMEFYTSVFPDGRIGETFAGHDGKLLFASFHLAGNEFMGLNGGPDFTFNEAVSFLIRCEDQAEVDRYWEALGQGGRYQQCGWLKDRFGVSWQVTPSSLLRYHADPDREKADRVMQAMMKMVKLDIAELDRAYAGR